LSGRPDEQVQNISERELIERLGAHARWLADTVEGTKSTNAAQLSLIGVQLPELKLSGQTFANSELVRCHFAQSRFEDCDFSAALLFESDLSGSSYLRCSFRKAELNDAVCRVARFVESDFSRADLTRVDLRDADLTRCNLASAWLVESDLREANLEGVTLEGARIIRAKLYNSRRFTLGSIERALVQDVDTGPDASGQPISSGAEVLERLRAR
jgi:fluoroquinolone resistance protein